MAIFSIIFVATTQAKAFWVMDWPDITTPEAFISYGFNSQELGGIVGAATTAHLVITYTPPPNEANLCVTIGRAGDPVYLTSGGMVVWPMYIAYIYKEVPGSADCYEVSGWKSIDGTIWI